METRVIAHRLTKEPGSAPTLFLRSELNPSDSEAVQNLVAGARKGLRRSGAMGKFARDTADRPHEFEALLEVYLSEPLDETFLTFTHSAMETLRERITSKAAATGGNVVFVHYENDRSQSAGEEYLVVALVTEQGATAFDDQMNVIESIVLDLEHLKHGVRVKLEAVDSNRDGVLTLLSGRRASRLADYFSEFLGSADFSDSIQASQDLKRRLNEWSEHQSYGQDRKDEILALVYRYWKEHEGASQGISIEALGCTLYPDDSEDFLNFMTDEDGGIAGHTPPIKPSSMRHFHKFLFNQQGLRLEFERSGANNWSSKIRVDARGSVVIRDAPQELIDEIRSNQ